MNGAPQLTGKVGNRVQRELHNSSLLANDRLVCSVLVAVVASLAIYSGTASMLGANLQQNTSGSSLEPVSGAPVISATPEHVTLTNGNGSTQIQWNTGKGSSGFVFVTEDAAKPVLFANGPAR